MTDLSPLPRARAPRPVDAVEAKLRERLLGGTPAPGETLAPERELAVELGVSRLTLRAAIARLEAEGLVRARQGDGVRVLDPRRHATLAMLAHVTLAERLDLVRAFLELRRAVASEAVALACVRMADRDVHALEALVAAQSTETDASLYAARDLEISRAVLVGADNFAMLLLLNSLESVYRAQPELADALHADRPVSLAGYAAVIALLRARDPSRARDLLRTALEVADQAVLERLAARRKRSTKKGRSRS